MLKTSINLKIFRNNAKLPKKLVYLKHIQIKVYEYEYLILNICKHRKAKIFCNEIILFNAIAYFISRELLCIGAVWFHSAGQLGGHRQRAAADGGVAATESEAAEVILLTTRVTSVLLLICKYYQHDIQHYIYNLKLWGVRLNVIMFFYRAETGQAIYCYSLANIIHDIHFT